MKSQKTNLPLGNLQSQNAPVFMGREKIDNIKREVEKSNISDDLGYMKYINSIQKSGKQITIHTVGGGEFTGLIRSFDERTISLRVQSESDNTYRNKVFFISNVIYFEVSF